MQKAVKDKTLTGPGLVQDPRFEDCEALRSYQGPVLFKF